ncbi:MAG TPA: hypothetical protein VE053_12545 [Allosphingosinicella sp.]|nr:hypothetical protein [Allosphingosinicella sp.]
MTEIGFGRRVRWNEVRRTFALWLIGPAVAISVSLGSSAARAAETRPPNAERSSDLAYGTASAIRALRSDRLILGPETKICVATTLDPEAKRIVEASGQVLYPRLVEEVTYGTTVRLGQEFRYRDPLPSKQRRPIRSYIDHELDPRGCNDRPDTIRVWQRIVRGKSALGYGVRLEANQGSRAYILTVERPYAVIMAEVTRGALDHRVTRIPGTERPYWDPVRDVAVMADMFILHLLNKGKVHG